VLRAAFQEEESFDDLLGLRSEVNRLFREASSRGATAGPVFVDASEGDRAYRLSGRYRIEDNAVEVSVNVFRGTERVGRISVRGTKDQPVGLAQSIHAEVSKILKP
jgi:hypothetical protein